VSASTFHLPYYLPAPRAGNIDDRIADNHTDANGYFYLTGSAMDLPIMDDIDPVLVIWHNCNMQPLQVCACGHTESEHSYAYHFNYIQPIYFLQICKWASKFWFPQMDKYFRANSPVDFGTYNLEVRTKDQKSDCLK
jgi:hypothetical protein